MGGVDGWWQDLRIATRWIVREPRFAVFVVLTLALGIGGNAATYGVADRVLLGGPTGVEDPDRLVRLYLSMEEEAGGRTTSLIPWATGRAIREQTGSFSHVAIRRSEDALVEVGAEARPRGLAWVDAGYFALLGAQPQMGRTFDTGASEAVISDALWRSELGGRAGILGSLIRTGGATYSVVGVMPEGFAGAGLDRIDVWLPMDESRAGNRNWQILARLPADVPVREATGVAEPEADAIHRRTDPGQFFRWATEGTVVARPIDHDGAGAPPPEAAIARLLVAGAALILLIASANVASLMLARLTRRRRELAMRLALGVGRAGLARLLFAESLVLAVLAGIISLPVAWLGGSLIQEVLLPGVAWSSPLAGPVLVATLAITLTAGLLVALLPLRRVSRISVADGLQGARSGEGRRRPSLHLGLATLQVTFSALLIVGAGLFLKSFQTMRVTDLGVDARNVAAVTFQSLDSEALPTRGAEEYELYQRALEIAASDPDVADATVSLGLPFLYSFGMSISVPGRDSIPELPGGGPYLTGIQSGYFETLGTSIIEGRGFTPAEVAGAEPVVVVSASMAGSLWPGESPRGKCVRVGTANDPCFTVVGVVEDVHRQGYREPPSLQYYLPLAPSSGFGGTALVLRPRSWDARTIDGLRQRLASIHPAVDWVEFRRLESLLDDEARPWRMGAWILGSVALLAFLVSITGVYGVLSYLVEQRRREIGVRIALGASGGGVQRLIVRSGLGATLAGLMVGMVLAAIASPWIEPLLFETRVLDPVVMGGTAMLLAAAAALACWAPARRASRVAPVICLSQD